MSVVMEKKEMFSDLQAQALKAFDRFGFPDRHHEDWRHTPVDSLLQRHFTQTSSQDKEIPVPELALDGYVIQVVNGTLVLPQVLPEGLYVKPLLEVLATEPERVQSYFARLQFEQGFQALNLAQLTTGLFLHLKPGVQLAKPIVLQCQQTVSEQVQHIRHLIVLEEGASASVVDYFEGKGCYFNNVVSTFHLEAHAKMVYYKVVSESVDAFHISHASAYQKTLSQFSAHTLTLGGALVRNDLVVHLEEPKAHCLLNGLYLPKGKQVHDNHTKVHHYVPHCTSFQDYKGIVQEKARAIFNGKVIVDKGALKTEAHQYNKNLLLSTQAEVYTEPQLEINADDVICTHGATVGQLDEDALFYLATRGLSREQATLYLIHAFVVDNIKHVPMDQLAEWMTHLIDIQLGVSHD